MAMSSAHQNFVSETAARCRVLLAEYGELSQLNVLWAGTPNYDALITQEEIDSVPSFQGAGLTTQNLADAEFALATILGNINNSLVALTILANLP